MKTGVEVLIDYFTFTVKGEDNPSKVITDWLGMDPGLFQTQDYSSLQGYTCQMFFSGILVAYAGREQVSRSTGEVIFDSSQMGVCVSMSGKGCRTFETYSTLRFSGKRDVQNSNSYAFSSLFAHIVWDSANVTRVDLACDDKQGYLDLEDVEDRIRNQGIRSRMRKRKVVLNYDDSEYEGVGSYIGSPSSDFRMRFYDKALEQETDGHWVRCELVFRHEEASALVEKLASGTDTVGDLSAKVLNDKISFIYRDDSNISRCSVCEWWADFVAVLESVRLVSRKSAEHSVYQIAEWVRSQVGPSLAVLAKCFGYGVLRDFADAGMEHLNERQESLIEDWLSVRRARQAEAALSV